MTQQSLSTESVNSPMPTPESISAVERDITSKPTLKYSENAVMKSPGFWLTVCLVAFKLLTPQFIATAVCSDCLTRPRRNRGFSKSNSNLANLIYPLFITKSCRAERRRGLQPKKLAPPITIA